MTSTFSAKATTWRLFVTVWVVYVLHFATNIVREHYPAFALAERGTLRVDPYVGLHPDIFVLDDRGAYINNNPGASLVAAIPYALLRPLVDAIDTRVQASRKQASREGTEPVFNDPRPNRVAFFAEVRRRGLDIRLALGGAITQALAMAPLSAASVVVVERICRFLGVGAGASLAWALLYAFGTPLFFRTGYLNHNLIVGHATFFAWALLVLGGAHAKDSGPARPLRLATGPLRLDERPGRLALAGGLCAFGLLCDYSAAPIVLAFGAYVLAKLAAVHGLLGGLRRALWVILGGAAPVTGLLGYQAWAFGNPFLPAQHYMPVTFLSVYGWNGFDWPAWDLILRNLGDGDYGIFACGPLLALGLLAAFIPRGILGQRPRLLPRAELAYFYVLFLVLLLFTSANAYARLQWNTGFRMLSPALPFLFLMSVEVLSRLPVRAVAVIGGLAVLHAWCQAMVRDGAVASVVQVFTEGPTLPWLTSIWRGGAAYSPMIERMGPQAAPLFVPLGLGLYLLWRPFLSRPSSPPAPAP